MATTEIVDFSPFGEDFARIYVTDEHPSSNYKIPVLIIDKEGAYGPLDMIHAGEGWITAAEWLAMECQIYQKTANDELVKTFLRAGGIDA